MANSSEVGLNLSSIGMLIVAARRSIRQLIAAKVVPLDITPHHYWMLMVLFKGAPMSLGELARAMWMDNPTVSRMVQQMGLRGYLKEFGPANESPLLGGLLLCEKLLKIGEDFQEGSQKGMTAEEAAVLREIMCKYIRNLDVMVANELPGMPIRPQHHHEPAEEQPKASGI